MLAALWKSHIFQTFLERVGNCLLVLKRIEIYCGVLFIFSASNAPLLADYSICRAVLSPFSCSPDLNQYPLIITYRVGVVFHRRWLGNWYCGKWYSCSWVCIPSLKVCICLGTTLQFWIEWLGCIQDFLQQIPTTRSRSRSQICAHICTFINCLWTYDRSWGLTDCHGHSSVPTQVTAEDWWQMWLLLGLPLFCTVWEAAVVCNRLCFQL